MEPPELTIDEVNELAMKLIQIIRDVCDGKMSLVQLKRVRATIDQVAEIEKN